MRSLRPVATFLAIVFGSGTLSPLVGANWQEWAKATGNDQYFVKYAGAAVTWAYTQASLFVFVAGFFVGGAVFLWLEFLLRGRQQNVSPSTTKETADSLAHGLHMPSNTGMNVIVDQKKKVIQIGFNLRNNSAVALRYSVKQISVVIDGRTIMNPNYVNKGGIVSKGDTATFFFSPIPRTVGNKEVQAEASIVYEYGSAKPDEPPLRESNYRVGITITAKSHAYLILEQNDGPI